MAGPDVIRSACTDWDGHYNWCLSRGNAPDGTDRYETNPGMDEARSLRRSDLYSC